MDELAEFIEGGPPLSERGAPQRVKPECEMPGDRLGVDGRDLLRVVNHDSAFHSLDGRKSAARVLAISYGGPPSRPSLAMNGAAQALGI